MFLSVIIPTRGRDACLRQTLRDLAIQDYGKFDIWIVDQNERPLSGLEKEAGAATLRHETMAPLGSHAGRNHAIFKTGADICVFVDDDVRLTRGFLSAHAAAYAGASPRLGAVAGRVVQPRDGYTEENMRRIGRPARYNRLTGTVSGNFVGTASGSVQHIHECNFSARAESLRLIGGFNEEFQGNAYFEGADLALRLIEAGYEIVYRPEIALTHLQEGSGGNRVNEKALHAYWYMRNYGLLNSLHMSRIGLPVFGAYGLAYILGKALKNGDPGIAARGIMGLLDGLRYFRRRSTRLRTRRL